MTDGGRRAVGYDAVDRYVKSNMLVGLGTGSTALWSIQRIGEHLKTGTLGTIVAVCTSYQSSMAAQQAGIALTTADDPRLEAGIDVAIDGADEVDRHGYLTKGGGAALLLEKIVAYAARRMIVVVVESKLVANLGVRFPIPIEVIPAAWRLVSAALRKRGADAQLRMAERKMGPVVTDNGNFILDCRCKTAIDAAVWEIELDAIPGVVENGLFTRATTTILVGSTEGAVKIFDAESGTDSVKRGTR